MKAATPEPLAPRPVPPFPGFWRMLGPGVIWLAMAQGSGELVWWPWTVAKYGLGFLFLLIPACLLQLPLNYQLGSYTILTGESIFQGFIRLHRVFALLLWILMAASFLWFGGFAGAGGTSLAALTGFPRGWKAESRSLFWAYLSIAVFFFGLLFSKRVYSLIEKLMWAVSVLTVVGLAAACCYPEVRASLGRFTVGLVRPELPLPRPWDSKDASTLLTAITFAGLGGFWTLFYSYWLREKGVGMAAYAGESARASADKPIAAPRAGSTFDDTPENRAHLARWRSFLLVDAGIGVGGNLATTLMTCLLAFALLHPAGRFPEGQEIAVAQASFFEASWGVVGRLVFLFVAACFLADSWVVTLDSVSRVHTDFLYSFFPKLRRVPARMFYRALVIFLTAVTAVTLLFKEPGALIQMSAILGFAGTVCFSYAFLFLNYGTLPKLVPKWASPGRLAFALQLLAALAYTVLALLYARELWTTQ